VHDANGDGLNDIIMGSDHGYGLAWFEQKMEGGKRTFVKHWIETEYPTFHTMALADLTGDGKMELITGKQLLAHNGGDVGALEPSVVFYYTIDKGRSPPHSALQPSGTVLRARLQRTAAEHIVGAGHALSTGDMDGDGRQDVVIAGRTGLWVFFNKGFTDRSAGGIRCRIATLIRATSIGKRGGPRRRPKDDGFVSVVQRTRSQRLAAGHPLDRRERRHRAEGPHRPPGT
jgi:hypothetical protein